MLRVDSVDKHRYLGVKRGVTNYNYNFQPFYCIVWVPGDILDL